MTTPRTSAPEWAAAQATPWTGHNQALRVLDAAASRWIIEDRDLTAPPGSCADGACYLIKATATGAWAGLDGKLAIALGTNAASGWHTVTVAVEGVQLYIRDENTTIEYDGAAWNVVGSLLIPFSVGIAFTSTPTGSEVLALYTFAEAVTFLDDWAGAVGDVGTNPTSSFVLDVQKNGSAVGTVTISTGGAFTFATTGAAVSFAIGDQIKIIAPVTADATVANVSITFKGERD